MSLKSKKTSKYLPIPADRYMATCIQIWDLGEQEKVFKGESKHLPMVRLVFELLDYENAETGEEERRTIAIDFTNSIHKQSNMRKKLGVWLGISTDKEWEEFNLQSVVGMYALLNIINTTADNGNVYANIEGIMKPKQKELDQYINVLPNNPIIVYDIDTNGFDFPEGTPEFMIELIKKSSEYKKWSAESEG